MPGNEARTLQQAGKFLSRIQSGAQVRTSYETLKSLMVPLRPSGWYLKQDRSYFLHLTPSNS
jgi:hypothetical protein